MISKQGGEILQSSHRSLAGKGKIPFQYAGKRTTSPGTTAPWHVLVLCLAVRQCKDLFP